METKRIMISGGGIAVATNLLEGAQKSIGKLRALFEQALAINGKKAPPALTEAIDLFAFLADEYAAMLERWKKRQRKQGS
jgi:hypothetical protein